MRHHLYNEQPNLRIRSNTLKLTSVNFMKKLKAHYYDRMFLIRFIDCLPVELGCSVQCCNNDIALNLQNFIYGWKLDIERMQFLLILLNIMKV